MLFYHDGHHLHKHVLKSMLWAYVRENNVIPCSWPLWTLICLVLTLQMIKCRHHIHLLHLYWSSCIVQSSSRTPTVNHRPSSSRSSCINHLYTIRDEDWDQRSPIAFVLVIYYQWIVGLFMTYMTFVMLRLMSNIDQVYRQLWFGNNQMNKLKDVM